jgi:NhaA family Na+:H+ antiporter
VGILTLLGKRVPPALRVLLLALAIIDDLGAIIVIALFYSHEFAFSGLLIAAGGIAAVLLLRWLGVRAKLVYVLPGIVVWAGILSAGIHPTIAGVILGLLTPVDAWLGHAGLVEGLHKQLEFLEATPEKELTPHELSERLAQLSHVRREALSPAESLIEALHPYVAFGIMPLFALANAGVSISDVSLQGASGSVAIGAAVGLVLGKPIGVILACVITLRIGWAKLPTGLSFKHLAVLGAVAGVGFTMALFIAQLAFTDVALLGAAKSGVLIASGIASVVALLLGRVLLTAQLPAGAAESHDDAESSTAK